MKLKSVAFAAMVSLAVFPAVAAEEEPEFGLLVEKPGVEETHAYCSACHSERIVAQQGLTRKDWAELLEWMIEEQEMELIEEPDYTIILDYLDKHYNTDRPNFPR
ncbi:MAG: aldehyde dehydrogenase [Sneathiella sp.]